MQRTAEGALGAGEQELSGRSQVDVQHMERPCGSRCASVREL